jgi:hypothetical protein
VQVYSMHLFLQSRHQLRFAMVSASILDASLPAIKTSVEVCDDECKHTQPHMHSVLFAGCVNFSLNGTSEGGCGASPQLDTPVICS